MIVKNHQGEIEKTKTLSNVKRNRLIFYCLGFILPLLQFAIFNVYVNYKSISLAFTEWNYFGENAGRYTFAGFENFKWFFEALKEEAGFSYAFKNGFICYGVSLISMFLTLFCAYFIYKNFRGGWFFQCVLMIPSILPGLVLVSIFKYFVEDVYSEILSKITGDFVFGIFSGRNINLQFFTLLFYGVWFGFAGGIITYVSLMRGINHSVVEAAMIDGVNKLQELFLIVIPLIWPTFSTFFIMGIHSILTASCNQFLFYQPEAPKELWTFGYWLYLETLNGTNETYPHIAAVGILLTCVCVPLTMGARKLMLTYGPSAD